MSNEDLKAELERLRNENAALKKGASSSVRIKVSEKGAVSIYGMGRFPVTLYQEQWLKLLDMSADIREFIVANEAQYRPMFRIRRGLRKEIVELGQLVRRQVATLKSGSPFELSNEWKKRAVGIPPR